jgi:prepilin-type N-terminal cleavage/methylation domain-containing protein
MRGLRKVRRAVMRKGQAGFTLLETLVSLVILLAVSAIMMTGMTQLIQTQGMIGNRTDMHTSVRSATELLEQEIGQAGTVSLAAPGTTVTMAAIASPGSQSITLTPNTANIYVGEQLLVDDGSNPETVTVTGTNASPTAVFLTSHPANTVVYALGGFAAGVIPPSATNGSTGHILKLFGDLNGDGNIYYVEYKCTDGTSTAPGLLYRNQMLWNAASKPAYDNTMILLNNVLTNPNDPSNNAVPCFTYQTQTDGFGNTYVVDVAVTLTVQTQNRDPRTRQYQPETKALLNVSPRNVFDAWKLAGLNVTNRIQATPATVTSLLP